MATTQNYPSPANPAAVCTFAFTAPQFFFFQTPAVNGSQPRKWFRELVETGGLKLVYYVDASIASSNSGSSLQFQSLADKKIYLNSRQ